MNVSEFIQWLLEDDYAKFYANECRRGLFAGFLTVATFLFSVKTFLLVTLHRDIYSDADYLRFRHKMIEECLSDQQPLAPLKRLSSRLHISTLLALFAAITQFTLGMLPQNWSALIASGCAITSVFDLCLILFIQKEVIDDWIESLENKHSEPDD